MDETNAVNLLEEWISSAPIPTAMNLISWWTAMSSAKHPLVQMALDYLSIPGVLLLYLINSFTNIYLFYSYLNRCRTHIFAGWFNGLKNETLLV